VQNRTELNPCGAVPEEGIHLPHAPFDRSLLALRSFCSSRCPLTDLALQAREIREGARNGPARRVSANVSGVRQD
jgi:hypothetical protein